MAAQLREHRRAHAGEPVPDPDPERDEGGARQLPWSRALLLLVVAGPPLWLGGVKPWIVPLFALVVAGLLVRRCLRSAAPLRVPALWWLGLAVSGVTALQWLPLPPSLLAGLAPGLHAAVTELTAGTELGAWNRLSVAPGNTGLELARVLALTGLFLATAQLSWRLVATYVAATGTVVALIGLVQRLAGATAIYGVYAPQQPSSGLGELGSPLLTSFINPNHQSGLLLVGLFAAAATAVDLAARAHDTRGRGASQRLADRAYTAWAALAIQATALVLSMSRAALLAAVIVAPLALVVGLRRPSTAPASSATGGRSRRLGLAAIVVIMLGLAATQGAWAQLASLTDTETFAIKLRTTVEGATLLKLSPVLGTGRGTFVDLFPLVDSAPGHIQFTHLESTPVAFVVEWGLAGLALVLGAALWWWRSFRASPSRPRRLALCGLLALAIQSGADFSLDYLGVAAPAIALAGSISVGVPGRAWTGRRILPATLLAMVAAQAVAIPSIPASWSARRARDQDLLAGEAGPGAAADALARTPLDPFVHLALAREHAAAGEWQQARARAEVAARLRPASLDAHLLAAVAAAELGAPLGAVEHLQRGLEAVRPPVPPALVTWLLAQFPEPSELPAVAPSDPTAWLALIEAIGTESPAHALALASARARTAPDDPEPLRILTELALAERNYGLALHHARLLAVAAPHQARSHKLRFDARVGLGSPEQLDKAIDELEQARLDTRLDRRDVVDELLITALLRVDDDEAIARAQELLDGLLAQRAKPEARERRQALAERVRARAGSR